MASESYLAVATVANVEQNSADYTVNSDAIQLLESVEALNQEFEEEEEFNLESFRQITDAISATPTMINKSAGNETSSTSSSKRGRGKGRNSKKVTQQQQQQQQEIERAVPENTSLLLQSSGVPAEYVPSQTMDFIQNNNISPVENMSLINPQLRLNFPENRSQAVAPSQVFSPSASSKANSGAQMTMLYFQQSQLMTIQRMQ